MKPGHPITIEHAQTKQRRTGTFECFDVDAPVVVLHFGTLVGNREFSLNTGYGKALATSKEALIREWRIVLADLEVLRSEARAKGKKVRPCGKSPWRPREPKKGKPPHPRQLSFGDNR